ncbi:MAG: hypothetical protein OJF60_000238 [Burkholderiaceae bacterium]|jgi:hypothetical protein|nr:MAG: hypothetical protein OJF60_000238 [Burkholderiaceae bacterium]
MGDVRLLWPITGAVLIAASYRFYGWGGVALASGALLMWLLLRFNRMMQVLGRAATRPVGHIDNAVMLNARLRAGMTLLNVLSMTRALGEMRSPKNTQPEIFRWTDTGASHVTAEFRRGRLVHWTLFRPIAAEPVEIAAAP